MINQYRRLMVDLETGGTRPGCAVFSIGACFFSTSAPVWKGPTFYAIVGRDSCKAAGLVEQEDTMTWWGKQKSEAADLLRQIAHVDAPSLGASLLGLTEFITSVCEPDQMQVWGNGADFDNPILAQAFHALGMERPWAPYGGRCYRTLKGMRPGIKMVRQGTHHNALDDAVSQAEHAVRLLKELKG